MPVPDFQSLMLPVLRALADGKDTPVRDVRERVASAEGLTDGDLREMLPSGRARVFVNRIAWGLGAELPLAGRLGGTGAARSLPDCRRGRASAGQASGPLGHSIPSAVSRICRGREEAPAGIWTRAGTDR